MREQLIIGNWKMNGSGAANAERVQGLIAETAHISGTAIGICPPFPYLAQVRGLLAGTAIRLGAQNLSDRTEGAYTGEVSGAMLHDLGCRYVLVGHSERRSLYGESDAVVADKFAAALGAGLTPVLCVGETGEERQEGITHAVISRQLQAVIDKVGIARIAKGVIAYEPVWAIGTGETASPEQAQEVHQALRLLLATQDRSVADSVQLLYGGSVRADNAAVLFAQPDIDGGLIGGASLNAATFASICRSA
ncbi:triose-phosphate isomerase [Stutzerimonas chloritidismutans]|uniref:triose-phosphate isomerase n=1 Tax=Stutzerimonas chloritidismutans TaxID=203192 RepID=UPI003F14CF95